MATYRPVAATDRDRFEEILQHAFAIEQGPSRDKQADVGDSAPEYWNDSDEWPPTLSEPRGIFEGDRLVSVCKLYDLDAYLHDDFVTVGGLGGVATPPEHRREGHVCTLAAGALAVLRK